MRASKGEFAGAAAGASPGLVEEFTAVYYRKLVSSSFHFVPRELLSPDLRDAVWIAMLLAAALLCPSTCAAQDSPANIIAHIQGNDVSLNDQMLIRASTFASVANGNVVTVHSGEATMRLVDGGEISICGPAKFTVLANSDGAITLALDFGRMHADLPASIDLRVLTPAIVATPIDIAGGKRDITVGLDQNDSLCVLATLGAVQLEQQFSGQRMMVPESADFSLQSGQLIPIADMGGSCQCALPQIVPAGPADQATETAVEIPPPSVAHPVAPDSRQQPVEPPAVAAPVERIDLPLVYSSALPPHPDVPTPETAALIRDIHDDPDWEFTGRVAAPDFARAMSRALGVSGSAPVPQTSASSSGATQRKSRGFWASLKHWFVG